MRFKRRTGNNFTQTKYRPNIDARNLKWHCQESRVAEERLPVIVVDKNKWKNVTQEIEAKMGHKSSRENVERCCRSTKIGPGHRRVRGIKKIMQDMAERRDGLALRGQLKSQAHLGMREIRTSGRDEHVSKRAQLEFLSSRPGLPRKKTAVHR